MPARRHYLWTYLLALAALPLRLPALAIPEPPIVKKAFEATEKPANGSMEACLRIIYV